MAFAQRQEAEAQVGVTDAVRRARLRAMVGTLVCVVLVTAVYRRFSARPRFLPLTTVIDGVAPKRASRVVVFLHGRGGGVGRGQALAKQLRDAGLPADTSVVSVEGPYATWVGHQWGETPEQQAVSRARLRALLEELLGEGGPPPERVLVAGFSQGAGLALDLAVEEPRIGAVASFSPCASVLRGELPKREGLRSLLVHGRADSVCPVEESRSLARVLESASQPVQYVEFDGGHVIPEEAIRRLVSFAGFRTTR